MSRTLVAAALAALCTHAWAAITEIRIDKVEPFAGGHAFGEAGTYERLTGVAKGELDPADPRNKVIVNLDKAPRNAAGKVEYEIDIDMLRPADPRKGNRRLLLDVTNRGRKFVLHWVMDGDGAAANNPRERKDAGNALFLRQGYTIVWNGWDPDAPTTGGGMTMRVPVATDGGKPIVRTIRDELVSGTRAAPVAQFTLSHEAAELDTTKARLTVRRKAADTPREIASGDWAYADARTVKLLPEGTKPEPGSLYELRYAARNPRVLGIAFAATRDLVSFLRYEGRDAKGNWNPAGLSVQYAYGFGISQSGRYLRTHISQGFNQDEHGRIVFDGVLTHITGVGRVFVNYEFGMPARTNTQHEDHTYPENDFPFSAAAMSDPVTGRSGSLFRGDGFDPYLIQVNTSTEYWQKGASLLHTDTLGRKDVALPKNARIFMIASTQHAGRVGLKPDPGACVVGRNPHSSAPALRALLVALDDWVSRGIPPPDSRVPTIASGTLVEPATTGFPAIPGVQRLTFTNEIAIIDDWTDPKIDRRKIYRSLVSKVDADGNDAVGIRLPDIAVPLATYTGWNFYGPPFPEGEICDRDGSYIPFPATKEAREKSGDPRRSIEERYPTQAAYVDEVKKASDSLVKARLLLQEDADAFVERAREAKDRIAAR
jgi:Alpha/beta hydrolase domain